MNNREFVKLATGIAVTSGTGIIVSNLIKATTPATQTTVNKVLTSFGGIALGGMISGYTLQYSDNQLDYIFETIDKIKSNRAEKSPEGE